MYHTSQLWKGDVGEVDSVNRLSLQCCGRWPLPFSHLFSRRPTQNIFTISVKSHIPQPDTIHQLLRILKLAIPTKDRVDKLATRIAAHGHLPFATFPLGGLPHEHLASLEQLLEPVPEAVAAFEEVFDNVLRLGALDPRETFIGTLDLAGQLNQEQPQVTGNVGHGS